MKTITIPKRFGYPTLEITVNHKRYTVKSGEEITIDDALAEVISNALLLEPKTKSFESLLRKMVEGLVDFKVSADDLAGIEQIAICAFYNSTNLVGIEIPEGTKEIMAQAFYGCKKLTVLEIPTSITSIGSSALHIGSATEKATIKMMSVAPPSIFVNTFYAPYLDKIIVPKGSGAAYKADTNWSGFADYIVEE